LPQLLWCCCCPANAHPLECWQPPLLASWPRHCWNADTTVLLISCYRCRVGLLLPLSLLALLPRWYRCCWQLPCYRGRVMPLQPGHFETLQLLTPAGVPLLPPCCTTLTAGRRWAVTQLLLLLPLLLCCCCPTNSHLPQLPTPVSLWPVLWLLLPLLQCLSCEFASPTDADTCLAMPGAVAGTATGCCCPPMHLPRSAGSRHCIWLPRNCATNVATAAAAAVLLLSCTCLAMSAAVATTTTVLLLHSQCTSPRVQAAATAAVDPCFVPLSLAGRRWVVPMPPLPLSILVFATAVAV
jgi:hypothetical protein